MLKLFVHTLGLAESSSDKDQRSKKSHLVKKGSKVQVRGAKVSPEISQRSIDFVVRIVHKGGSLEVYQHELPASVLLEKYPEICVALPGVFRDPHRSVLKPEDMLLLGHKYIMIPFKDVEKLKSKYPLQGKGEEPNEVMKQETLKPKITKSPTSEHKHKESGETSVPNGVHGQEIVVEITQTRTRLSPNGCLFNEENCKIREGNGIEEGKEDARNSYGYAKDNYLDPKDKLRRRARTRRGLKGNKSFVPPLPKTRQYRGLRWKPRLPTIPELSP